LTDFSFYDETVSIFVIKIVFILWDMVIPITCRVKGYIIIADFSTVKLDIKHNFLFVNIFRFCLELFMLGRNKEEVTVSKQNNDDSRSLEYWVTSCSILNMLGRKWLQVVIYKLWYKTSESFLAVHNRKPIIKSSIAACGRRKYIVMLYNLFRTWIEEFPVATQSTGHYS